MKIDFEDLNAIVASDLINGRKDGSNNCLVIAIVNPLGGLPERRNLLAYNKQDWR